VTIFGKKEVVFALLGGLLAVAPLSHAQTNLGPITVGAGLQTSYSGENVTNGDFVNTFALNHARLYVSGPVYGDTIKFMFNTDYDSVTNKIGILDAVAQFSFSPHINIWAGRFLPPSDRANLHRLAIAGPRRRGWAEIGSRVIRRRYRHPEAARSPASCR